MRFRCSGSRKASQVDEARSKLSMQVRSFISCIPIIVLVFFFGCSSQDNAMNDKRPNLALTPEEQAALERDERLMQAARQFNEQNGTSDKSFAELFPTA